jgi:hypothetical protein
MANLFEKVRSIRAKAPVAHEHWEEEALVGALIDWAILHDVSFLEASSVELQGLLVWNRTNLLTALPSSLTTISSQVQSKMVEWILEIRMVLMVFKGKIALSLDVWTLLNYLSILVVVAHFVGE